MRNWLVPGTPGTRLAAGSENDGEKNGSTPYLLIVVITGFW